MNATTHTWAAAGSPAHVYKDEACSTVCATCAASISQGVPLEQIETPTTANHADYFRFGSKHICPACAWMFAAGKGRPGNYIATPDKLEYTVISLDSVVADKRPWIEVLAGIAKLPPYTQVTGVMTTDVKPRLWPRTRLATVGNFGLYLHCGDYDVSEWRNFSLSACLNLIGLMIDPLAAGYAKASLYHGLLRDHARSSRDLARAMDWEARLSIHRGQPHFLPALIAAGVTKERKHDIQTSTDGGELKPAAKSGNRPDTPQPGLF